LRDMLGLSSVVLDRNTYIIHCTVPNIAPFEKYTEEHTQLLIGDTICHFGGIYSEDFMQQESCGNGNGFLIIVPDKVSEVLYEQKNVLVVKTLSSLSLTHIEDLNHIDKNVLILSKTGVRNQSASMAVYTVLPLFYFAFVSAAIASIAGLLLTKSSSFTTISFMIVSSVVIFKMISFTRPALSVPVAPQIHVPPQ